MSALESSEGSLTIVGTGYGGSGRVTPETEAVVRSAHRVFYLVSDPETANWLRLTNPNTISLHDSYREGRSGRESCDEMAERIVAALTEGKEVCAAFYGHPCIFVSPAQEAAKRARALGFIVSMLPAISAMDCLYADIGFDPGVRGCQVFESTDFVVRMREPDPSTPLIILQAGAAGAMDYTASAAAEPARVAVLMNHLLRFYSGHHEVTIYETAPLPVLATRADAIPLSSLASARLSVYSTLFVPPGQLAKSDGAALTRLGLVERNGRIGIA